MLVRLRPVVHATPTPNGLHLRGWASSCTLTGGAGLWKVWQRLAPQLAAGIPASELGVPDGTSPAVRAAVELILEQLREHDMLVSVPEDWGADAPTPEIAAWLESVAADPAEAWRRLRGVTITVCGSGVLAGAAVRAATAAGLAVQQETAVRPPNQTTNTDPSTRQPGSGELTVHTDDLFVEAGCGAETGYVLPPTTRGLSSVNTEVTKLAEHLGPGEPTEVLAALIASAAIHRLVCAAAGLPDPSTEFVVHPGESQQEPIYPMALVAHLDPLRATYHPLLTGPAPEDPWRALDALTDPELGPVDTPQFGDLPQVPANLATSGNALGIGTTADSARLDAALNAVKADGVIGLGQTHARGTALRLAARFKKGEPVHDWATSPTARRWWKALTLRFAIPAEAQVERLAPGVFKAEIRHGNRILAWAVEATAGDAAAFAALAATGYAQAERDGTAHLNGAAPQRTAEEQPDWVTPEWLWPADVRTREEALQQALAALPGIEIHQMPLAPELQSAGLIAYTVDGAR
ncbi:hypothetical protein ACIA8G_11175 [Lentzea sp. NPDC051213]|uniref:hypothetical protein n=1 Tax=Lentzea sp. NPDC051213 TaxID=3364126 RepID=UPI0037A68B67